MTGCDVLFRRFFAPWYQLPPGARPPRIVKGDIEVRKGAEGQAATDLCRLSAEQQQEMSHRVETMVKAARQDWATYMGGSDVVSLDGLDAFDVQWTRAEIAKLVRTADAGEFSNDYLVLSCELGAVLGEVMRALYPGLEWLYASPYWESSLWHRPTASRIHVFHWAVKKMSAYGAEDGLHLKVLAGLESLREAA